MRALILYGFYRGYRAMNIVFDCKAFEDLAPPLQKEIKEKTHPSHSEFYYAHRSQEKLCFTATIDSNLAAFALVTHSHSPDLSDIDQITLENPTLGPAFIAFIDKTLAEKGCMIAQVLYEEGDPVEQMFMDAGWGLKTPVIKEYYFDIYAFHPKWFDREYPLPQGFSFALWKDIPVKEKEKLKVLQERSTFHHSISPTSENEIMQPVNSVVLLHKGNIAGWMITHTLPHEPDTIRYSAFYVFPEFRARGLAVPLLQHAIRLQQGSPLQWTYFTLNLDYLEGSWEKFVDKHLRESAYSVVNVFRLSKAFY